MPALLIAALLACAEPPRFPSPHQVGRGVPDTWIYYQDPDGRFEVAFPQYPSIGRFGATTQVTAQPLGASFSLLVTDPLSPTSRTTRVAREVAATTLSRLNVEKLPEPTAWEGLADGLAWSLPDGEVRAGIVRDVAVVLVARNAGGATRPFVDTFSADPMVPTRVAIGDTAHALRCPSRCGPDAGEVVVPGALLTARGLAGMIGHDRYRALALSTDEAPTDAIREALLRSVVGDAVPLDEAWTDGRRRYRTGREQMWIRRVEGPRDLAVVVVLGEEEPSWGEALLSSVR